jgi:hypothetical protein
LQKYAAWFAWKEIYMNIPAVSYDTGEFSANSSSSELEILGFGGNLDHQPEKQLMLAILLDAVECYQQYAGDETNRLFKDTEEWIFAEDQEWLFSFINICEAVDIAPQYLRKGLLQWNNERSRKVSAAKRLATESFIPIKKISRKSSAKRSSYSRLRYPTRQWPTERQNQRSAVQKTLL